MINRLIQIVALNQNTLICCSTWKGMKGFLFKLLPDLQPFMNVSLYWVVLGSIRSRLLENCAALMFYEKENKHSILFLE